MKLALGTVQFGLPYGIANASGRPSLDEAGAILQAAYQFGLDTLDTAIAYGESEEVLGKLGMGSWRVVTKLPAFAVEHEDVDAWARLHVKASMQRLGVEQLYGLLLHAPSQLSYKRLGQKLYSALLSLKAEGLVHKIGVSVYGVADLEPVVGNFAFDLVQAPVSILDRSFVESGWAKRLKEDGVEVHSRSTFLQGLLLMAPYARPPKFNRWTPVWREWDRWLTAVNLTPLQACLRYASNIEHIDKIIIGVDSRSHLEQCIAASCGVLPSMPNFAPLLDDRLINPASWSKL